MLVSRGALPGVVAGEITLVFRRWASPETFPGARLRTEEGIVGVVDVAAVAEQEITDEQARRAGFRSAAGLLTSLDKHGSGPVHRVELSYLGPDPQPDVREEVVLTRRERAEIDRQLTRRDVESWRGSWTGQLLELLRENPGVRAAELAGRQGRGVSRFKSDVFVLRQLGLVERYGSGYRLSMRAVAYLDRD